MDAPPQVARKTSLASVPTSPHRASTLSHPRLFSLVGNAQLFTYAHLPELSAGPEYDELLSPICADPVPNTGAYRNERPQPQDTELHTCRTLCRDDDRFLLSTFCNEDPLYRSVPSSCPLRTQVTDRAQPRARKPPRTHRESHEAHALPFP